MSNAVFPAAVRGLTYNVTKGFEFSNIDQSGPNKTSVRIQQTRNPIWHWTLLYDLLKDIPTDLAAGLTYTDLQTMMGFYAARGGTFDDFLFEDPDDNSVAPAMLSTSPPVVNTQAELQVFGDGAGNYYSPIQRKLGGLFWEDITDLNGSISVYANGVLQHNPADYTIGGPGLGLPGQSFMGLYIAWTRSSPPASPATPISAQFNFYFRVRFESDRQDFDKFINQWWTAGGPDATSSTGIRLVSSRAPGV